MRIARKTAVPNGYFVAVEHKRAKIGFPFDLPAVFKNLEPFKVYYLLRYKSARRRFNGFFYGREFVFRQSISEYDPVASGLRYIFYNQRWQIFGYIIEIFFLLSADR